MSAESFSSIILKNNQNVYNRKWFFFQKKIVFEYYFQKIKNLREMKKSKGVFRLYRFKKKLILSRLYPMDKVKIEKKKFQV